RMLHLLLFHLILVLFPLAVSLAMCAKKKQETGTPSNASANSGAEPEMNTAIGSLGGSGVVPSAEVGTGGKSGRISIHGPVLSNTYESAERVEGDGKV
ncbi:hypothetical protein PMAYCL1PPCAC_09912, partial [Pristionchus mayeri]